MSYWEDVQKEVRTKYEGWLQEKGKQSGDTLTFSTHRVHFDRTMSGRLNNQFQRDIVCYSLTLKDGSYESYVLRCMIGTHPIEWVYCGDPEEHWLEFQTVVPAGEPHLEQGLKKRVYELLEAFRHEIGESSLFRLPLLTGQYEMESLADSKSLIPFQKRKGEV